MHRGPYDSLARAVAMAKMPEERAAAAAAPGRSQARRLGGATHKSAPLRSSRSPYMRRGGSSTFMPWSRSVPPVWDIVVDAPRYDGLPALYDAAGRRTPVRADSLFDVPPRGRVWWSTRPAA